MPRTATKTDLLLRTLDAQCEAAHRAGEAVVFDHSFAAMLAALDAGHQAHADGHGPTPPAVWSVFEDEALRDNWTDGWHEAAAMRAQFGR